MTTPKITATRGGKPLRINFQTVPPLDKEQRDGASLMFTARRLLLLSDPGAGKCLGYGTPVIMADGSIKQVQDIVVGDRLANPEGAPNTVTSLASGKEMMYEITPVKGDKWTCNASHLLSLETSGSASDKRYSDGQRTGTNGGQRITITADALYKSTASAKHSTKLWRPSAVTFDKVGHEYVLDPYILGIWLGDGNTDAPALTNVCPSIVAAWRGYVEQQGCYIRMSDHGGRAPTYYATSKVRGFNPVLEQLRAVGVLGNKHIPAAYKTASPKVRAAVLAGLFDTDGAVSKSGVDYVSKIKALAEDVVFLCRSIGLAAYMKECVKGIKSAGYSGIYYRVSVSGDVNKLPTRRLKIPPRQQKKDPLVTGFSMKPIGMGDYYGFTLTGNRLFMLGDFTVTHNTLTALRALMLVADDNPATKTLIVCPPIAVDTWVRWTASMYRLHERDCAIEVLSKGNSPVTIGTTVLIVPHSLLSRANPVMLHRIKTWGYDVFINDESDGMNGWTSQRTRAAFGDRFDSGLSEKATYRWMLTGTALPRYNDGFYPVLRNLFPDKLAKHHVKEAENFLEAFTTRETVKFGRMRLPKKQVSGSRNNKLLNHILFDAEDGYPCALRIKLKLAVPLHLEAVDLDFPLSTELRQLEEELESVKMEQGDRVVDPRMATALRMLGEEAAPHVTADILADMADKRARGDDTGVLILYWHTSVGEAIARSLSEAGYRVAMMNGATKQDADAETEAAFNAGRLDFVVGQIKAMGVAINLQENCCDVRFAEDSFSDAANQQAYQRVYRRGQHRPTTVTFYRAVRTELADMKPRVAEKKRKGAHEVLDGHLKV